MRIFHDRLTGYGAVTSGEGSMVVPAGEEYPGSHSGVLAHTGNRQRGIAWLHPCTHLAPALESCDHCAYSSHYAPARSAAAS